MSEQVYEGRLVADGNGNLLADEGERAGDPVAYNEDGDNYVFLKPGEPSHNERFHQQYAEPIPTQDVDPELPGYAGTPDAPEEGMEHHFIAVDDRAPLPVLPDSVSSKISGHTNQPREGEA